jgi:hypothetical protein
MNDNDNMLFDEAKARELIYFLLNNDSIVYKKLIPEIKNLNSEALEHLFQGTSFRKDANDEEGYYYNVKNKKMFEKLLDKFDNFYVILDAWYKDKKYYQYLKQLWSKYISIQNLFCKNEKEMENKIEEILNGNKIDYTNWPEDIKDEFKILVKSTGNTRIMELKDIIDNRFSELKNVVDQLVKFKEACKHMPEVKNYELNTQKMITMFGGIMLSIAFAYSKGMEAINYKQLKLLKTLITYNNFDGIEFIDEDIKCFMEEFEAEYKGSTGTYLRNLLFSNPGEFNENISVDVKCIDGKIDNLDITKKIKIFLKSKWVSGLHCVLSFLNLGWSVYELRETFKNFNVVKQYEKSLEDIRTSFNSHKLELGILPDDSKESIAKIMEVYNNIREDQKQLQNLMEDILKSINILEFQQKKATGLCTTSVALGVAGVAGTILTGGTTTAIYGISTVVNAISAVVSGTNIYMSMEIVKNLNDILKRAIELNKEIQDTIDNLINELNKRIEIEPKFNLNESNSSISTNI